MVEIIPKNWFRQSPFERVSPFVSILYCVYVVLRPVVHLFAALTVYLDRILSGKKTVPANENMRDDFQLFVRESVGYGTLDHGTASILNHAIALPGIKLSSICIPIEKTVMIPSTSTIQDAFEIARMCNLDKLPVCHAETASAPEQRTCVGIFRAYDAILNFDEKDWRNHFVTECMGAVKLLEEDSGIAQAASLVQKERVELLVITDPAGRHKAILPPEKIAEILFE